MIKCKTKNKLVWGEKRYYQSYKDNSFMHTIVLNQKTIDKNYIYIPRNPFVKLFRNLFYYLFAVPVLWVFCKIKFGVKVKGKDNLKLVKGGCVLIGNHSHPADGILSSVMVANPKKNYLVCNKDAVQVVGGKYFTKALGALPLSDEPRGMMNLCDAIVELVQKGACVTIFPEACIWPNHTKLRPLNPACFHYAVKANVPVIPFAVTYRYAKGKNYLNKKPKLNITICEPIIPNIIQSVAEARTELASKTEQKLKSIIENEDNVALYEYLHISEKENR